jgi:NTE family protein
MKKQVALVLSSGGARGLAHIGIIKEIERQGFEISSIAGSSIGSVIGAVYAMGKLDEYTAWVKGLTKKEVWDLLDLTISLKGIFKGDRVFETMQEFIPDMLIEDLPIPYAAVASDIFSERQFVFTQGSIYKAMRASIAIPALFSPVKKKEQFLVDGGILNPAPIEHVQRREGDILVVSNLYGKKHKTLESALELVVQKKADEEQKSMVQAYWGKFTGLLDNFDNNEPGFYGLLSASSSAMISRIANLNIELFKPDIIISTPSDYCKTLDFHKASQIIKFGEEQTKKAIEQYMLQTQGE